MLQSRAGGSRAATCWKRKADGERAVTGTGNLALALTVALTVVVTVPVSLAVAVTMIVIVILAVVEVVVGAGAVRCSDIGGASVKGGYVELPHHHLQRPRSSCHRFRPTPLPHVECR